MSNVLTQKDLEDAAAQALANFGTPDIMMWDPGLARQFRFMFGNSGTSETNHKIRNHFLGQPALGGETEYKDFEVMTAAAKAFGRIGLDKDQQ